MVSFSIFRSFNLEFMWTYYQIRILFKLQNRRNWHETIVSIGLRGKYWGNETGTKRIVWGGREIPECFRKFPSTSGNSWILPKIPEYFRKFPNTSANSWILPQIPELFPQIPELFPQIPEWFRTFSIWHNTRYSCTIYLGTRYSCV